MQIGKGVFVASRATFSVFEAGYISLGNHVFIKEDFTCISLASKEGNSGKITIGEGTHINKRATIVANNSIIIGKNCLFAINVSLFDHDHIFSKKKHPTTSGLTQGKPIVIGDDVYLGNNVVILRGVTLGNHVIVGANSVVTKSFSANSIIAGTPAKLIRKLQ